MVIGAKDRCSLAAKERRKDPVYREKMNAYQRAYQKKRYHTDPVFKSKIRLYEKVTRITGFIVKMKTGAVLDPIGCSVLQWMAHLESKFTPEMNWDNYGKVWELDHIDPVCADGSWNYMNIRPLLKEKNREKIGRDARKSKTERRREILD